MEFLFDLLPLIVIYAIARALSRKRREAAQAEASGHDEDRRAEAGQEPDLAAMLQALGLVPPTTEAAMPDAHRAEPSAAPGEARRPTPEPRRPTRSAPPDAAPREKKPTARPKPAPRPTSIGTESGLFEQSDFVEGGARRLRREEAPAPPAPASRYAARLRNPDTAREAMVLQMLLERRGGPRATRR